MRMRPARRRLEPGDQPQHGALAAAGRPDQHQQLAVGDLERQIAHGDVPVRDRSCSTCRARSTPRQPFTAPDVSPATMRRCATSTTRPPAPSRPRRPPGSVPTAPDTARGTARSPPARSALGPERERQREQELVPAVEKGQDGRRREPGPRQRQDDRPRTFAGGPRRPRAPLPRAPRGSWRKKPTSSQIVSGIANVRYGRTRPG